MKSNALKKLLITFTRRIVFYETSNCTIQSFIEGCFSEPLKKEIETDEKIVSKNSAFHRHLSPSRILVRLCHAKRCRGLVRYVNKTFFESAQLDFWTGLDNIVPIDGLIGWACVVKRFSSQMGKNRLVSFWIPIDSQRLVVHCVFWV